MLSMHPRVDLARDAAWQAGNGLELFEGGAQERFGSAEVIQDPLLARRPDAGELVEDGGGHGPPSQLAMVSVREAVSLVAHALEKVELGRVALEGHGLGTTWLEDLFVALGERA